MPQSRNRVMPHRKASANCKHSQLHHSHEASRVHSPSLSTDAGSVFSKAVCWRRLTATDTGQAKPKAYRTMQGDIYQILPPKPPKSSFSIHHVNCKRSSTQQRRRGRRKSGAPQRRRSHRVSQIEWIAQAQNFERSICGTHAKFHALACHYVHCVHYTACFGR